MEIIVKNSKGKGWKIGPDCPVFIVAEIGKNFIQIQKKMPVSVYLENAKKLVDTAKASGADAVKFQTHYFRDEQSKINIVSPHFNGSDRYNWVRRNNLVTPFTDFWLPLKKYCDSRDIIFFSTPMSKGAARLLNRLGVKLWKVGSGDILDFVMLDFIAKTKKPIILSSGMSTLKELQKSIDFLERRNSKIILLHAVSKYPCLLEDLNLSTIRFLKNKFNIPIGFSDHSLGYGAAVAAVGLGAKVIEKHFSFSRNFWGADHGVSMLPDEFKKMVSLIRKIEKYPFLADKFIDKRMLGRTGKFLQKDEAIFRPVFRKTLVAAKNIQRGEIIKPPMLYAMRPQKYLKGVSSEHYEKIIGRKTSRKIGKLQPIKTSFLE